MHLLKCENGHIYDSDKFRSCPHCSTVHMEFAATVDDIGDNQADVDTEIPEASMQMEYEKISRRKVVGMLICKEGEMQGEGFLIREGENAIGRASNMDVALVKEVTISRKHHATIRYQLEKGNCILSVNAEKNDVYINGKKVENEMIIGNYDELMIGDCKLIFIEAGMIWQSN